MKKAIVVTIGILVVAFLALADMVVIRDEIHWWRAYHKDQTASYESYMKTWPAGRHVGEAKVRYDERGWADAEATNTIQGFELYVANHRYGEHIDEAQDSIESLRWLVTTDANTIPGYERYIQLHRYGKHSAEAHDSLESLHWKMATAVNTIRAFQNYTTAHPEGRHVREAEAKSASLSRDDALFEAAYRVGTEASLKKFLEDFPGHRKSTDAQRVFIDITEGRDIVDLLSEKKVEIQTHGRGIKSVNVRVRRLVPYQLTIRVPVGSYFVSARQSSQNMVTTTESKVRLTSDDWQSISVSASCANRRRDVPGNEDSFTVQRSPHQKELAKLMPVMDKAGVNSATRQAAVWIVTDDASYSDLGILVSRPYYQLTGGTRTIREEETARAMQICDEAGIDVTRKRIWSDRQRVLQGLEEGALKKWLEAKQ